MRPLNIFKNKYEIWIYSILITSSVLSASIAVKNIKISPDSMRFGLVSKQILSGNGIRVPVIRLEDNYVPVNGAIPFLDQMPLLPILFAIMGGVTYQNHIPAQVLNLFCHVATAIFTFLIMKKLCTKGIALLTGILVSFPYPLLFNTHHISSETLFVALISAAIYFLILSRDSEHHHSSRNLFIASICSVAAILTRNAGIAMIPVFFWEAFIILKNKRPGTKHLSAIVAITLPVITTAAMFVRNYIISGSLRGFSTASPDRPYIEAFKGTIEMIFRQFTLGKISTIMIALAVAAVVFYILINSGSRKEIMTFLRKGLDLIIVFMLGYTILIGITMAKQQWRFDLRYVSPLVPFLFISSIFMIFFIFESIKFKGFYKLSLCGMILFFSIITFGNFYKTFLNFSEFFNKQEKAYSILNSCTYKWLMKSYGKNILIATNRPYHLSFFGGYSTIALPHKRFEPTIHVPDDMESILPKRMSKIGAQVIALFEEAEEQYEGSYITELFNKRETNDKFILAHECSDGVVYNLKQ